MCLPTLVFAQVGIGTSTPNSSAKLEIVATNQGFLPPRISLTATTDASTIGTPATGLLVYNTASAGSGATAVTPGYYYFNGTAWARLIVPTDESFFVTLNTTQTVAGNKTFSNDLVVNNLVIGRGAGSGNYIYNSAVGVATLGNNTSGWGNTGVGYHSLKANTTGMGNSAFGFQGQMSGTTGSQNTSFGFASLIDNITGSGNTSIGYQALQKNIGSNNIAIGSNAMYLAQNATGNIILGNSVLQNATSPSGNVVIGMAAGSTNFTNESNNTLIGYGTQLGVTGITNATALGNGATVSSSNTVRLGNNAVTTISVDGNVAKSFGLERHTVDNTAGNNLTLLAGGAKSASTDKNGGNIILNSGVSTGSGSSNIILSTASSNSSGTSDNTPTEKVRITGSGQVGIGTQTPHSSSILELNSTSKGLLLPRLTVDQRDAISSPTEGLLIYNTTAGSPEIYAKSKKGERVILDYTGTPSSVTGTPVIWQEFTPLLNGYLTSISIYLQGFANREYELRIHAGDVTPSLSVLNGGSIIGYTSVVMPSNATGQSYYDFKFSEPIFLKQNTKYWYRIVTSGNDFGDVYINNSDVYASHNSYIGGINREPFFLIKFQPIAEAMWISLK